jgi:hypothetical protein
MPSNKPRAGRKYCGSTGKELKTYNKFSSNNLINPDMVCFCDIPIGDLGIHIKKYGQFGLAFKKSFLIERGANPVLYVERNSAVTYLCESKDNKRRKIPLKQNISMKWLISIKIAAKPFLDIRDP